MASLPQRRHARQRLRRQRAWRFGHWAESVAAMLLRLKGYRILARRLRLSAGEIDIVAKRGRTIAFVEVKARPDHTAAITAVTPRQQRRLLKAALQYAARDPRHNDADFRFDVMLVAPGRWPRHVVDAWRAESRATE